MKSNGSKVLIALVTAVMMMVMAVPMVGAAPTAGDTVVRDPIDESSLYGLRFEYRNYGYLPGMPNGWGTGGAWAGQMSVTVTDDQGADPTRVGEQYLTFCLDFYESITAGDMLMVDSALNNNLELTAEQAAILNYIMATFEATDDLSGAAIQCAIWYFQTSELPTFAEMVAALPADPMTYTLDDVMYQFMTDPDPVDPVADRYDAKIETVAYPDFAADPSVLRDAAFDIIADVEAAMPDLSYPYSISITPETMTVDVGVSVPVIITVLDQYDMPFEGASVKVSVMLESQNVWLDGVVTTDENGQFIGDVSMDVADTVHIRACILGGEAIWVYDPAEVDAIQDLVIPNEVCDEAIVTWESECYFPDGHTPGFWKNNARKWLDFASGASKKYVGYQVYFEDYEDYLDAITGTYGGDFSWLSFTGTTVQKLQKAYTILNYGGSSPLLKAQKHMLSALLTWQWYEADDPGYYGAGCVELDDGSDMNIDDAIAAMLEAYADGNYALAHGIAESLNEQVSS